MQGIASFAMRGRVPATAAAGLFGALALVLPAVGILSAAVVALVTLRQGAQEGLLVGAGAAAMTGLIAYLLFASPLPVLGLVFLSWLPIWLLALVLRFGRSLSLAVQAALGIGLIAILVVYAQEGDPQALWTQLLEPVRTTLVESHGVEEEASRQVMQQIAGWMTGAFAAGLFLQLAVTLFVARWWQGVLYNPGGFRQEFQQLRAHPVLGYAALPLIVLSVAGQDEGWDWVRDLLLLLVPLFMLQGLAVLHNLAARTGIHKVWLLLLYLLLVFAMPHAALVVSGVGLADTWVNIRARFPNAKGAG